MAGLLILISAVVLSYSRLTKKLSQKLWALKEWFFYRTIW